MIIRVLLIIGVLIAAVPLLLGQGAQHLAIRRILTLVFMLFAVASIFRPALWTRLANLVGVGRGTDLVLYALVVAFLSFVMRSYLRNRALELQVTRLARRIALDEAGAAVSGRREGSSS